MEKKKKKKAFKVMRTPKKPISITWLMRDKVIYHLEISHLSLRERIRKHLCTRQNRCKKWLKKGGRRDTYTKELTRAIKNNKVKDFISFILKECETRSFSVADMKDLAALIPDKIGKAIITNDERVKFKI